MIITFESDIPLQNMMEQWNITLFQNFMIIIITELFSLSLILHRKELVTNN